MDSAGDKKDGTPIKQQTMIYICGGKFIIVRQVKFNKELVLVIKLILFSVCFHTCNFGY